MGLEGNDTLDGGAGADTMDGGIGDDVYFVDNSKDVIIEGKVRGTDTVSTTASYILAEHFENITLLGNGNTNATGSELNNVINGNKGNNIIDGKEGANSMAGGKGNDRYFVDDAGDVVTEIAELAGGVDSVVSKVSFTLTTGIENLTLVMGSGGDRRHRQWQQKRHYRQPEQQQAGRRGGQRRADRRLRQRYAGWRRQYRQHGRRPGC